MRRRATAVLILTTVFLIFGASQEPDRAEAARPKSSAPAITGFYDSAPQQKWEKLFLAVPAPKRAEAHLRTLTAATMLPGNFSRTASKPK
jgi:hypothetical protein